MAGHAARLEERLLAIELDETRNVSQRLPRAIKGANQTFLLHYERKDGNRGERIRTRQAREHDCSTFTCEIKRPKYGLRQANSIKDKIRAASVSNLSHQPDNILGRGFECVSRTEFLGETEWLGASVYCDNLFASGQHCPLHDI